jgi:[ribosomal protein S5]-alanine N-acetyltransferase
MTNTATTRQLPPVRLVPLPEESLAALLDENLAAAGAPVGLQIPAAFLSESWLWELRLEDMRTTPVHTPWLVRAVVVDGTDEVVGHAGFHGAPGDDGIATVSYAILPEQRGKRYAKAALAGLIEFAAANGAEVVRATIDPENASSLGVIRDFGFEQVGDQWDEEDGRELIFDRPAVAPTRD